jgi:hypothetical protein
MFLLLNETSGDVNALNASGVIRLLERPAGQAATFYGNADF